jgi:Xaa-Pro aminopeptidase
VYVLEGQDVPDAYLSPARQLVGDLRAREPVTVADGTAAVTQLRARKSPAELSAIRQAE